MQKRNKVAVALDKSGSMDGKIAMVLPGVNELLGQLQQDETAPMTDIIVFVYDSQGTDIIRSGPVRDMRPVTESEYRARALTPYNDNVMWALDKLNPGADVNLRMLIDVSDGLENASRKYPKAEVVRARIAKEQTAGLVYIRLGNNIDAAKQAETYGTPQGQSINFSTKEVVRPQPGLWGKLGGKIRENPAKSAFIVGAALGLAWWAYQSGKANAAPAGFTDDDRNKAMGVDGVEKTWQQAVADDVGGFVEPFQTAADLPDEVRAVEEQLQANPDFDPTLGSLNEDGEQVQAEGDVLSPEDNPLVDASEDEGEVETGEDEQKGVEDSAPLSAGRDDEPSPRFVTHREPEPEPVSYRRAPDPEPVSTGGWGSGSRDDDADSGSSYDSGGDSGGDDD